MTKLTGGGSSPQPQKPRGPSSHPGPGGNWPAGSGNKSGKRRGSAPPKKG